LSNIKNLIVVLAICAVLVALYSTSLMSNILYFGGSIWLPFLTMAIGYSLLSGKIIGRVLNSAIPCLALSVHFYFVFVVPSESANDYLSQAFFQVFLCATVISGLVLVGWGYAMGASRNANK